ncbi:MAG: hypothetical protein JWP92_427 [Caulobacter sp.]|nr:hypothetical protein [Caulobacter sp.]
MSSPRRRAAGWAALLAGLAPWGAPAAASAATAADQLYERSLMRAADLRCRLFTPTVAAALDTARLQARGAALRSGTRPQQVAQIEGRALAKATATDCRSQDLVTAAARVRQAFAGYAQLRTMTYPGAVAAWRADRANSATIPVWRLSQPVNFGPDRLIFGLAGRGERLTATATFADNALPYAARLVLRDPSRTAGPYLPTRPGRPVLSSRVAPRDASLVFAAESRDPAPVTLLPTDAKTGLSFRFPREAIDVLARLDPREAIIVEFAFTTRDGRDAVRRAYVEVGDFAAGRAFLK